MNQSITCRKQFGLGTDHLWPLVVLVGIGLYASLVPLPPNDFWWHLKIGEIIYHTGSIPTTNMFGWTLAADFPFTYGAWLSEYLFYILYRWGGVALITFVRTAMLLLAFGLVGYEARRRTGSWRLAALAIGLAGLMTVNNLIVRPQNWSWLPFVVMLILFSRYADRQLDGRWLLACPAIMAFWVNVHGAFILGIIMAGIFVVGEAARTWLKLPGALGWKAVAWLGCIGLLMVLATLINPQGVGIFGYVQDLMTDRPSQQLVIEWQSPPLKGLANVAFFASVLAMMMALACSRYRLTPTELLLVAAFLWLAWSGQRYVVWFGMTAMPIFVRLVQDILEAAAQRLPFKLAPGAPTRNVLNIVLALLVLAPLIAVQPWFIERLPLPPTYWQLVWRDVPQGPLLAVETPVAAAEYLRQHPGGRLFNNMGQGSYLIWAVPEQGVFVDTRVELYPYEQWLDYIKITRAARYNEILDKYGVDRILLDSKREQDLAAALAADPLWHQEYEDQSTQIWRKAP